MQILVMVESTFTEVKRLCGFYYCRYIGISLKRTRNKNLYFTEIPINFKEWPIASVENKPVQYTLQELASEFHQHW